MNNDMKMRAQYKGEYTEIKILISHPMETGRRKNDVGELISALFIQQLTVTHNGLQVLSTQWGTGISKNPYLTLRVAGAKVGDSIAVNWTDNAGNAGQHQIEVAAS